MKRLVLLAVALTALVVVATAVARSRDGNHDSIPDRWEARHHLSTTRNVAHRDPDRDDAANLAEFRHHTDPRRADTDSDGVRDGDEIAEHTNPRVDDSDHDGTDDGDEVAGKVASFDGTTLVITVNDNSTVSGTVNDGTEIKCEGSDDDAHTATLRHDGADDSSGPSLNSGSGDAEDEPGDDHGDDDQGEDEDDDDAPRQACTKADLVPGTTVHEAELKATSSGKVFQEIELVK